MPITFDTHQRGSSVLYGECGGIWVMTLFAKPTAADMFMAKPSLKTMLQRHAGGFPTLTWVLPQAGFSMDSDARNAAAQITKEFDAAIIAQATLVEGQGFQAAAVRAIIAGLDLMARSAAPKKVFADLEGSVAWCASLRRPADRNAGAPADVVATLAAIRKTLDDAPVSPLSR